MLSDTIREIMNNICDQIILKMCQLGVIVKEPLVRRASYDDYNLCFENFNRKTGSIQQSNIANYGVFTQNINLRNLKDTDSDGSVFSRPESSKISQVPLGLKQQELFLDDS